MHASPDRRTILAIAARADVDPRTVRRHLRSEPVLPAIARAIDDARAIEEAGARRTARTEP